MHDEGPSGEHETDFILIEDDDATVGQNVKEFMKEQKAQIQDLSHNLESTKWIIRYLEQWNAQLEDRQAKIELQLIKEKKMLVVMMMIQEDLKLKNDLFYKQN